MISQDLLDILVCPETKEPLTLADEVLIGKINEKISAGRLVNRGGQPVREKIDGGLVRRDSRYCYAIRDDIPIMLIDEAIPLENL